MGDVKTLTNLRFMIGFSDHQIAQVTENVNKIFTEADVYNHAEIWDRQHGNKIIAVIKNLFNGIGSIAPLPAHFELLDDILDDWNELFQGELYNLNIDNLTFSHLTNQHTPG